MTNRILTAAIFAASTAIATPVFALEAMRCNIQTEPGLFQPVLRIVMQGKIETVRMGTEGLTRSMFYRDREVLDYVAAKMNMPASQMPRKVSGVCGSAEEGQRFQGGNGNGGVVAAVSEPAVEPDYEPEFEPDVTPTDLESISVSDTDALR